MEGLNKKIRELEKTNLDLNIKNEFAVKKSEELNSKVIDLTKRLNEKPQVSVEEQKKFKDEVAKLKERLLSAEGDKAQIQTKLNKLEKELVEYKDIVAGYKERVKELQEQKKEIVYVEKLEPGKLKEADLAIFEKKCETLSVMCDTMGLIIRKEAGVMTDLSGNVVHLPAGS